MERRAIAALSKQKGLVNPTARPHRYPLPERDGWIGKGLEDQPLARRKIPGPQPTSNMRSAGTAEGELAT